MAKAFRKLEIELNNLRYVLDKGAAETLLERLDTFDLSEKGVFLRLREDLRASLATESDEPMPANPFADESDEPPAPWAAPKGVVKNVAKENAEACGDCRVPRCRFCGEPGERAGGRKDLAGRIVERYYVCRTGNCLACRAGTPQPLKLFAGGAV